MKGNFIKKLTAYALTAAMVMSTPMTAFASEFADNFWYADGSDDEGGNHKEDGGPSGTGTVTSTNTTDLSQFEIGRIEIDPPSEVLDDSKKFTSTLTAKVFNTSGDEIKDDVVYSQIEWSTSNYSVVRPKVVNSKGRQNCTINGYKGGFAIITAGININGEAGANDKENREYDFVAKCRVMVRKTPTAVYVNLPNDNELYAGHTYDLNDYVTFNDDAFDAVDFEIEVKCANEKKKSLVTWSKDGVLSVDKKLKKDEGITLDIKASCQSASSVKTEIKDVKVLPGVPVTGFIIDQATKDAVKNYDIAKEYKGEKKDPDFVYPIAKVTAKTTKDNKITTDDITWSTSDSKIVRILAKDKDTPMNGKTEDMTTESNAREIRFQGMSVGKATITATSTSGKSAKLNVKVTATLIAIESAEIDGNATYTGKATPIVVKRIPAQNQDKLKIEIPRSIKQIKGKTAITPILTPNADLNRIVGDTKDGNKVVVNSLKVMPSTKKLVSPATTAEIKEFTIEQSDVKLVEKAGVVSADKRNIIAAKTVKSYPDRIISYFANLDPNRTNTPGAEAVSWESSKETVAKIVGQGRIQIVGAGSAKITVSSVYEDKPGKYKTMKQSFTIKTTPVCEQIVLKSNLVTVDSKKLTKDKTVTINVKQQLPKKAADDIDWYTIDSKNNMLKVGVDGSPIVTASNKTNNKKCTVTVKSGTAAGSSITVVAVSRVDNRVQAEAKIVVK